MSSNHLRCEVYGSGRNDFRLYAVSPAGLRAVPTHDADRPTADQIERLERIERRVRSHDAQLRRTRRTRDELLSAVPVGKILALGATWLGDLKPVLDQRLDAFSSLVTPLTLSPTQVDGVLNLGRTWTGQLLERLEAATQDYRRTHDEDGEGGVDLSEIISQLQGLHECLEGSPAIAELKDRMKRLRKVSDLAGRKRWTADARVRAGLLRQHLLGDGSKPISATSVNERNAEFWAAQARRGTVDPGARVVPADNTVAAINAAHRRFWGN